jgi:hypothetical protein
MEHVKKKRKNSMLRIGYKKYFLALNLNKDKARATVERERERERKMS